MSSDGGLTVVKIGGSYALSQHLPDILNALNAARRPLVVVPGGGPFADTVRAAQSRMGFDDGTAHKMALLAMAQFAEALTGLSSRLAVAPGVAQIRAALKRGRVAVWSPWPMTNGLEALPASWQLTSDSLAAWLAGRLGARRILLLKHRDAPGRAISLDEAARSGLVDPLFPAYAAASGASAWWLGPATLGALTQMLDGDAAGSPLTAKAREPFPA